MVSGLLLDPAERLPVFGMEIPGGNHYPVNELVFCIFLQFFSLLPVRVVRVI